MARLILRAMRDLVCPICWDYCDNHKSKVQTGVTESELVIGQGVVDGVYVPRPEYLPVQVMWIDIPDAVRQEAIRRGLT